jgi:hypothetical protein
MPFNELVQTFHHQPVAAAANIRVDYKNGKKNWINFNCTNGSTRPTAFINVKVQSKKKKKTKNLPCVLRGCN